MRGHPGPNTQPHARLQPSFKDIDAWITSKLNEALVCKLRVSLMSLADILHAVCTTRHWQTSGRLVQELNVCTLHVGCRGFASLFLILETFCTVVILSNEQEANSS